MPCPHLDHWLWSCLVPRTNQVTCSEKRWEEIDRLFEDDLVRFERGVLRMSPNLAGRQSSFDAVVSFAFNAGVGNYQRSSIRMKNNRADYEGAAEAFMMWTIGGGKELPGLVRRRKAEKALYLRGV